jgi:pimeloyl-ACP methyl ester carboxylesterase
MDSIDTLDTLWISTSSHLKRFDQPLLNYLSRSISIAQWEYQQTPDEGSSLDQCVDLLHCYLQQRSLTSPHPIHLAGHGMGGLVALTYARRYPQYLKSLTLLAVAPQPANTWDAHYYVQRHLLPCSRQQLLTQTVQSLFGHQPRSRAKQLVKCLERTLDESLALHSLFRLVSLPEGGVSVPLMICGSNTDSVITPPILRDWSAWLKPQDSFWQCPEGRHFFHSVYPEEVGSAILRFWQRLDGAPTPSMSSSSTFSESIV